MPFDAAAALGWRGPPTRAHLAAKKNPLTIVLLGSPSRRPCPRHSEPTPRHRQRRSRSPRTKPRAEPRSPSVPKQSKSLSLLRLPARRARSGPPLKSPGQRIPRTVRQPPPSPASGLIAETVAVPSRAASGRRAACGLEPTLSPLFSPKLRNRRAPQLGGKHRRDSLPRSGSVVYCPIDDERQESRASDR